MSFVNAGRAVEALDGLLGRLRAIPGEAADAAKGAADGARATSDAVRETENHLSEFDRYMADFEARMAEIREHGIFGRAPQDLSFVPSGFERSPTGGFLPRPSPGHEFATPPWGGVGPDFWARNHEEAVALGTFIGQENEEETQRVLDELTALRDRIVEQFGPDDFFAKIIEQYLEPLKKGIFSPDQVLAAVRGYLGPYFEGLQREMMTASLSQQRLIGELLRFLGGGALPSTPTASGTAALPPAPSEATSSARETFGRIGADVAATREEVAGLGATFSRAAEQQTTEIHAAVTTFTRETTTVRATVETVAERMTAANQRLAEQWRSMQRWQQRVEADYLRPVQEGIVRANRELAEQFRTTQGWQQRVESGYLRPLRENIFSARDLRDEFERLIVSRQLSVGA